MLKSLRADDVASRFMPPIARSVSPRLFFQLPNKSPEFRRESRASCWLTGRAGRFVFRDSRFRCGYLLRLAPLLLSGADAWLS